MIVPVLPEHTLKNHNYTYTYVQDEQIQRFLLEIEI